MTRRKTAWYTACRLGQEAWKARTPTLPDEARPPGFTWVEQGGRRTQVGPFPICLPLAHATENLLPVVRAEALERFRLDGIPWHHGDEGPGGVPWPSGHLLDSQVQCVNVLMSLTRGADRGLAFVRGVEPATTALVEVERGSPVAFEWSGGSLLPERGAKRGRYGTSVDALLVAERDDGGRTAILVEWKYTESYDAPLAFQGSGGRDRREIYRAPFEASLLRAGPEIAAWFQEPHYQLLRLVLLAEAMVRTRSFGIDRVVVVHAVPAGNDTLLRTVPPGLLPLGATVPEVWGRLLGDGGGPEDVRFRWLDTSSWLAATDALAERYRTRH